MAELADAQDEVGWLLRLAALPLGDRLTAEGLVGLLQPVVLIEPTASMSELHERVEWRAFMAACGRDAATGDRLLGVSVELPSGNAPGRIELVHLASSHSFEVPASDTALLEQIAKLATVPVLYQFRSLDELEYRGVVFDEADEVLDVNGDGPEVWISRFGRGSAANTHLRAMTPVSRNFLDDATKSEVFNLDLSCFSMPARPVCVMCARPLEDKPTNREHIVPDWVRSLTSEALGTPVGGVVAAAHVDCNSDDSDGEMSMQELTMRRLAGESLTDLELGAIGYWMTKRIAMLDRAIGLEVPSTKPVDSHLWSADQCLPPQYFGRLGNDETQPFRSLVLGPWIYHLCWSEDGCADDEGVLKGGHTG